LQQFYIQKYNFVKLGHIYQSNDFDTKLFINETFIGIKYYIIRYFRIFRKDNLRIKIYFI